MAWYILGAGFSFAGVKVFRSRYPVSQVEGSGFSV